MQDPRDLIAESLPIMGKGTVTWRELQHSADLIIKRLQLEGWTIVRAVEHPKDHPAPGGLGSVPL